MAKYSFPCKNIFGFHEAELKPFNACRLQNTQTDERDITLSHEC